jgi:1-acyl-sn-glycerol-3-phosphate acyltransferase
VSFLADLVAALARCLVRLLCRLDAAELEKLPKRGPLIVAMNHVNFLDAPLLIAFLHPRRLAGIAKRETWKNPLLGALASLFGSIPVDREGRDPAALRKSLRALSEGKLFLMAPEGTRNRDGNLGPGHKGIVLLALHSQAPVIPVAVFGHTGIFGKLARCRRPEVRIRVGEAFIVRAPLPGEAHRARIEALDEIMHRISDLLPQKQRGVYSRSLGRPERHLGPAAGS